MSIRTKYIEPITDIFPNPSMADEEGLLAYGGNLNPEVLVEAYYKGVFPWYSEEPILWWSPDPRMVLYVGDLKVTPSLMQSVKKYNLKVDTNFEEVIKKCATVKRKGQKGTWITNEMQEAYIKLFEMGVAHSFEIYLDHNLVGGLYGLSLGKAFFGESMFHLERDASKVALYHLHNLLESMQFHFIDAQTPTSHLESLGAKEVSRKDFLTELNDARKEETNFGNWSAFL